MASSFPYVRVTVGEDDVPGAKLIYMEIERNSVQVLKRFLVCRKLKSSGKKDVLIERVKTAIANKVGIYQQVDGGSWLSIKADKARNNVTSTIAKPPYFPLKWAKFPTTGAIPKTFCYGHIYNYLVTSCELSSSNRDSSDSSDKENEEGNEDFLTSKPFRRGRQYVKSGYVSQLQDGVSKGYYAMKGIVQASYKAQAYNVMVMVSRRRDVVDANCYCSCVYRFEAQPNERIQLTINRLTIKNRHCKTRINKDVDRLECAGNMSATLRLYEIPWPDIPGIPRDCLCSLDKDKLLPFTYISTSRVIELRFEVTGMNASEDFTTLSFEGTWKVIRTSVCTKNLRMQGPSGQLLFKFPSSQDEKCDSSPHVIIPSSNKYLYVRINGVIMKHFSHHVNGTTRTLSINCGSLNRIKVHTALYSALICPYSTPSKHHMVQVFSEGWSKRYIPGHTVGDLMLDKVEIDHIGKDLPRSIVVEFIGKEVAEYSVWWLELGKRRDVPPNGQGLFLLRPDECQYRCPELDACINASVWCNGIEDCPSGFDEDFTHCSVLLKLPPIYLCLGAIGILISSFATCLTLWRMCRRRPRSILQTRLQSLSSDTAIFDEKGVIC